MKGFFLQTPFFRLLIAFITGILLFSFLKLSVLIVPLLICAIIGFVLHIYVLKKNYYYNFRWLFGASTLVAFVCWGLFVAQQYERKNSFENLDKEGIFKARVSSTPGIRPKSYLVKVKTLAFAADSIHFKPTQGNAILFIAKNESSKNLCIGDEILICTKLRKPQQTNNPEEFNYSNYLARKGIAATAYVDSTHWKLIKQNNSFSIFQYAHNLRNKLLEVYKRNHIESNEFAVLAALTLGYQDEIKDDLYNSYSNSGAMHILSVSGLHVGIIYVVFLFLLSFLNKTKQTLLIKSTLIIILLWGYAFITGLSPSVMRASLMFSLVALAGALNSKSNIYNSVFFSAFVLLLINPNYLFDVSFLLSYSAVLSIVYFHPKIKRLAHFNNKFLNWSWDLVCVSIAAQIATFPLGIFYFHKFSNYFLITNFLAIPISTLIIYLALALFITSPFVSINNWIGIALNWLLKLQNNCIVWIDNLPLSTYHTWINETEVFLLFSFITLASITLHTKRYAHILVTLICFGFLQISFLYRNTHNDSSKKVLVYAASNFTAIDFIDSKQHFYFTTDSVRFIKTTEAYWLKNRLTSAQPVSNSSNYSKGFFSFQGKKFCILTDSLFLGKENANTIDVDYLIIGHKNCLRFTDIENLFRPKTIVTDNSLSDYASEKIKQACIKKGIKYYSTKEKGCLTLKL